MAKIIAGHRVGQDGTIRVGCSAVIFDKDREKILLTRREDNNQWCLPSGGMEPGESASEACIREVDEETGLQVAIKRLIGVYTTSHELTKGLSVSCIPCTSRRKQNPIGGFVF